MTRKKFWAIVASGGCSLLLVTTGCGAKQGPCDGLERPSQTEIAAYNQGDEIETDVQVGTRQKKVKNKRTGKVKKTTVPVMIECDWEGPAKGWIPDGN